MVKYSNENYIVKTALLISQKQTYLYIFCIFLKYYGYEKEFKTLEELKVAMIKYINYYNNKRINKKRKGLSPLEYRQQYFSLTNKNYV